MCYEISVPEALASRNSNQVPRKTYYALFSLIFTIKREPAFAFATGTSVIWNELFTLQSCTVGSSDHQSCVANKIKLKIQFLGNTSHWLLNSFLWLTATILDRTDT